MKRDAWLYINTILLTGVALTAMSAGHFEPSVAQWITFAVFAICATLARLFKALFQSKQTANGGSTSYSPMLVFLFAGALVLPPFLFVLLVVVPHAVEWFKERYTKTSNLPAWYIQPFNVATHVIVGLAAKWCYGALRSDIVLLNLPSPVFAMTLAAVLYVVLNHLLIGQALVLARSMTWRDTGVLSGASLLPDVIMTSLGYAVATLWLLDPWMIVAVLGPLGLIHRALMVPQLKHEAQTDGKTGLANARHFATALATELDQAQRLSRPMTLLLADLDLLRDINNTYGHLAGDAVLVGISQIIRDTIRDGDLAARFGGEEFAIVLPNSNRSDAVALAERLRQMIAEASFPVSTSTAPIRATMSVGVACYPDDAETTTSLIHEADVAVYQAKVQGRNRVVAASDVPRAIKLDYAPQKDRLYAEPGAGVPLRETDARPLRTDDSSVAHDEPALPPPSAHKATPSALPRRAPPATPVSAPGPSFSLPLFVALTIALGCVVTALGVVLGAPSDLLAVGLLTVAAVLVELFQVNVYGPNTTSVSVAIAFAAAVLVGIPGVAAVSAAIAVTHYVRQRPQVYKVAFNWATHVLAGSIPAVIMACFGLSATIDALHILALPMAVAALIYYLIDTGLIARAIGLATGQPLILVWRRQFGWLVSHYVVLCALGLVLAIAYRSVGSVGMVVLMLPGVVMRMAQKQYVDQTERAMQELQRMNNEMLLANQSVQQVNEELFRTVATIFDARDPYVGGHASQVADYATAIAEELGLPQERIEQIRRAGYLHDIGKIAIPEKILHKPSKLTDAEYEVMKTHAAMGASFLETSQGLAHLAPFVRHHHERWDGRGYPDGLAGEQIPLEARILNVCDSVEAMAADRPYHKGMSVSAIVAEIECCSGSQFDPLVASVFIQLVERRGPTFVINSANEVRRRHGEAGLIPTQQDLYLEHVYKSAV